MPDNPQAGFSARVSDVAASAAAPGAWTETDRSRIASILASSDDALVAEDIDGIVTGWNPGAARIFGYAEEEMVGVSSWRLAPEDRREEEARIAVSIRRGESVPRFETVRRAKDARLIEVSLAATPIFDASGGVVGASKVIRDLTPLRERERRIAKLERLYATLSRITRAIMRMADRDSLFREVCRLLVDEGGFRMAWIGIEDPQTRRFVPVGVSGDTTRFVDRIRVYADERPEGRGPSGLAFRSGRPYICNDILHDGALDAWRSEIRRHDLRALAAFPVRAGGRPCGTLVVYADAPGFFGDKEVGLIEETAFDLSFALDGIAREEDRRRAADLARSEKLFSDAMIDSMPGILYFYDDQGRFLRWNKNFEAVSGYSAAEIAAMRPIDFFPEEERALLQSRIAEVFVRGESFVEASFRARDGSTRPHFFTGRQIVLEGKRCLVGVGVDVSERKAAEAAMRESEARYRTLFQYAPDGILIVDRKGRIVDCNASMCRMLGCGRDGVVGLYAPAVVDAAEVDRLASVLAEVEGGSIHQREWSMRRYDGSTFPAEVTVTSMPDGAMLAMIRDVTERKAADLALRELNQTLERKVVERTADLEAAVVEAEKADRIKSAFLATMSHELRTPLNSIIGFTGIVLQGLAGPLTEEQAKQLGMVRGSARHLLELINDVLDISKIEAGQLDIRRDSFDLPPAIRRAAASVEPLAAKKGLTLDVRIAPDVGRMTGDRRRLEQILINLLNNAVKFTERGGATLSADVVEHRLSPAAPVRPALRVRVADTGVGIRPEDLANLFQPFRQLDTGLSRQHEGTGLGLAICRRLAALMGGEIEARSVWREGSEFLLVVPLEGSSAS